MALGSLLLLAQTNAPDLPPDLFEPLAREPAASSGGLPLAFALTALVIVAVAGFVIGDRMPALSRAARRPRFEGCWIALWRSGTSAEFRAVVGRGAGRRVVGRSPVFEAPATGPVPDDGPARAAHEELVTRLQALGWEPAGVASDTWYQVRLEQRLAEGVSAPA